jgi:hypothetical protein
MKKLLWVTLLVLFSLQTNSSYSLELKLKIPKDLKTLGDKVKKELEKKEPKVKEEEVKTEEVKTEEVKTEEVKTEEVKTEVDKVKLGESVILNKSLEFRWEKNPNTKQTINFYDDFTARWFETPSDKSIEPYISGKIKWRFRDDIYGSERSGYLVAVEMLTEEKSGEVTMWNELLTITFPMDKTTYKRLPWNEDYLNNENDNIELNGEYSTASKSFDFQVINIKDVNKETAENNLENSIAEEEKRCDQIIANSESDQKSKTVGGYKDFYFGMNKKDVKEFIDCQKEKNSEIILFDATTDGKGYLVQKMYKYDTNVRFKDNKTNIINVQPFYSIRTKSNYLLSSGIEEFEQLKKALTKKYKLLVKPTKVSIEKFNSEKYAELHWVFKSNIDDNLILLILDQRPTNTKYIYYGQIEYLSSEESKIYSEKLDSKIIKSDDL